MSSAWPSDVLTWVAVVVAAASTVVGVTLFCRGVITIVRTVRIGHDAPGRSRPVARRTLLVLREALGHGRFQHTPAVRAAHWAVMVSFPVLVFTLLIGYAQLVDPHATLPVLGRFAPWEWLTEVIAWASLLGILALTVRRLRLQPRSHDRSSRFFGSTAWQAYYVEATVLLVVLCVLALRGLEYAVAAGDPATAGLATVWHHPTTAWLGEAWAGAEPGTLAAAITVVAAVKIVTSMTWFVVVGLQPAMGVAWHRFLAVVNLYARREDTGAPALGALAPLRSGEATVDFDRAEELPEDAVLGVGAVEDFTWKGLLDFSSCTECGRCQDQCPAWNTGKPLSPKLLTLALRDEAYAQAPLLRAAAAGRDAEAGDGADGGPTVAGEQPSSPSRPLVPCAVDAQVLWDCTTCGACVQQCPVDIEHVDHIVDMRRYQVLMASAFPAELGGMFRKLEQRGNPWGMPARQRLAWAKDLDFDVPVVGADLADASEVDYLFWVGCAGAFDDKAKATTRAVAELLHTAGVSFAVLGDGEGCTGDPARRAGNEMLFQLLAGAAIAALDEARPQAIVVTCAHCFNTIAREYPQLGGHYQVVHHTELLARLVAEGRLTPADPADPAGQTTVTYHDPCYLGRHNEIYTPPRALLGALPGLELTEMPRSHERSFCCGGGGARVWMEEATGTRISTERMAEAVATGAGIVATACPYCTVMLTDGAAALAAPVQVTDVAQVLLEAVRKPTP